MNQEDLTLFILETSKELGFHRVGLVPIEPPHRYQEYEKWVGADMHGTMDYMASETHKNARKDVRSLLPEAKSMVIVALAYAKNGGDTPSPTSSLNGFVARYARGSDYHGVMKARLKALADRIEEHTSCKVLSRSCVDSAPILEREWAERAQVGFVAKNTMLIAPGLGSYVLLGELLLDTATKPTAEEREKPRCGSCTSCLDACPTGAFADPYVLDARKCISYLTIEHRGPIPRELRPYMENMIFGCDRCQEVCPFNERAPDRHVPDPELAPRDSNAGVPDLLQIAALGSNQRKKWVNGTALRRVNREQMLRNVCVALGNSGDQVAIDTLAGLLKDRAPLVRGHAAWALGQLGAADLCQAALESETDDWVREEISAALGSADVT